MYIPDHDSLAALADGVSRRGFLTLGLLAVTTAIFPRKALAALNSLIAPERSLSLFNSHTGEEFKSVYWVQGQYIPEALNEINHIMRDYRTGDVKTIDPKLLDLLSTLNNKLETKDSFHIISGYRSPKTNALLRTKSKKVVKNSLHLYGKAVDIRLPGHSIETIRRAAVDLKGGGVGYYPRSQFVHVDIGRIRYW